MECKNLLLELEASGLEERLSTAAVAHLDQCIHCSGLVADLKAIQSASLELAEVQPPERVWVSLRNQLESEGLIREPVAELVTTTSSRTALRPWFRPALAAAYMALLLVAAGMLGLRSPQFDSPDGPLVAMPAALAPAAADAGRTEIRERNPVVAASYTEGLEVIDNFIRLCEKTVREQPNNETAREYLYDAYQQKATLLATTMERGAWGD